MSLRVFFVYLFTNYYEKLLVKNGKVYIPLNYNYN